MMFMMQGCGSKNNTICPQAKAPTQDILNKIKSLNDEKVNEWMIEQYKLYKKIKVCDE